MSVELRRFLLRHRIPMGGVLVGVLLTALVFWTFVLRGEEEDPLLRETLPALPQAAAASPAAPAIPRPGIHEQRTSPGIPPAPDASTAASGSVPVSEPAAPTSPDPLVPAPKPPASASGTGPARTLPSRPLETILGPSAGSAGRRGTTVLLGPGPLVLVGERLDWSLHVVEGEPTHVAIGILLEPLGGTDTWWIAAETDRGKGPYLSAGQVLLDPRLARAIRRAGDRLEVRLAAFHAGGDGRRVQVGGAFTSAPLTVRR